MRTDKDRAYSKKHYDKHKEKRLAASRKWKQEHRDQWNAYMRKYRAIRFASEDQVKEAGGRVVQRYASVLERLAQ